MAAATRSSNISPSISLHSTVDPSLFPLRSINDVVNLFKRSMDLYHSQGIEPDLTLLSIVAGYIELSLTTGDAAQAAAATAAEHASQAAAAAVAASTNNTSMATQFPTTSSGATAVNSAATAGLISSASTTSKIILCSIFIRKLINVFLFIFF